MAYEAGALEATLAAAADGDAMLLAELRASFLESLTRHADLLERARCDGNWHVAAMRLKGLAASFHCAQLLAHAEFALEAAPGDPVAARRIRAYISQFSGA